MKFKLLRLTFLSVLVMLCGGGIFAAFRAAGDPITIYSWEGAKDAATEVGGTAVASDGESVNYSNSIYYTIRLNGKNDFTTNKVTITLEKELKAGDKINITAYRNKNDKDKQTGALLKFDKGGTATTVSDGDLKGLEFVNIDTSTASAEDKNRGTEPNTITLDVPAAAAGSTVIEMTRALTSTNLFITKLEIVSTEAEEGGDDPKPTVSYPLTVSWDWKSETPASISTVNIQNTTGNVASDVEGYELFVDATCENGKLAASGNSSGKYAQFNKGTIIRVPVGNTNDKVTVTAYPGQYKYTVGGTAAEADVTEYTATAADVEQKYVEIVATGGAYLYSIIAVLNEPEQGGDTPIVEDVTANWDWQNLTPASISSTNIQGVDATGTVDSDIAGIQLNVLAAVAGTNVKLQYNANGYAQFNTNTCIQVPVKNKGDEVTVVSYPGQSKYTVGGEDATGQNTFTHSANSAEATQGYVEIIATSTAYLYSIKVVQKAQSDEPILVEKSIYKTDFSNWETASPSDPASTVSKKTLFTNETLTFSLFQTSVMGATDQKFAPYTTLPHMSLRAEKNLESCITTSPLAEITKIRFIHGATGGNRGWKLEAKGDGDEDWVVVSADAANPQGWCEVTKVINKKNVQLRFTNLDDSQNAYLFELEIFAKVDLSDVPMLGSFKANGKTYIADEIFEQNNTGNYEATIELFKADDMISAENPLDEIVLDNGDLGTITYEGDADQCTVTIPITKAANSVKYIAKFIRKPMLTMTYINVSGEEIGKQQVEKDTKIGAFAYDIADVPSLRNGYKARGWFKQNYVGEKFTTESVISEDVSLYAVETEIEVASLSRKYEFDLKDKNFYAEDHEAFNPNGGAWHDNQHGWLFGNGNSIDVLVGPKAIVSFTICKYSAADAKIVCGETELAGQSATDGDVVVYNHEGEAGTLSFTINASGSVYIHSVKIVNTSETNYTQDGQWYFVKAGDASSFIDALEVVNGANATASAERSYIFLPNGTYDLGTKTLTQISGHNISIIGESMEGVVIMNRPVKEGIGITATLLNTGSNNYLQDLTLDCIAPYGTGDDTKSAERGVALQDKGNKTICKNVYLKGLQDTYYSNGSNMLGYFQTSKIEGTVDFICGSGSIMFDECDLFVANRSQSKTSANVITANNGGNDEKGYLFYNCSIDGTEEQDGIYNFGRPWNNYSTATFINTTMKINSSAAGWTSMNKVDAVRFHEYNTKDKDGNVVTSHNVNACQVKDETKKDQLYLDAAGAAAYEYANFFTTWEPKSQTAQLEAPIAEYKDGVITITPADNGAIAYLIEKNGQYVGITATFTYTIGEIGNDDELTIRAANGRGGFGKAQVVSKTGTSIKAINAAIERGEQVIYNLSGQRVNKATRGLYIVNGKKVVIK